MTNKNTTFVDIFKIEIMHIVISPAKNISLDINKRNIETTNIRFEKESKRLLNSLKKLRVEDLSTLMSISPKLAQLNFERFQGMDIPFEKETAMPALLVFDGDVYRGMNVDSFSDDDLHYSQAHLSILSGFYGLLRPLDAILPYRLEMGTSLAVAKNNNLYEFWSDKLQKTLKSDMKDSNDDILVNLASNEYYKSLKARDLKCRIITPIFKDYKNDKYKIISFFAKKARGMMTAFIIKNRIENPEDLKLFNEDGYTFNDILSKGDDWVFTRG